MERNCKKYALPSLLVLLLLTLSGMGDISGETTFDTLVRYTTEQLASEGEAAFLSGDNERALEVFATMRSRYSDEEARETQYLFSRAFNHQGEILYNQGAYSVAMDSYMRARRIAERCGFRDMLVESEAHIGSVYASNADYDRASSFYRKALGRVEENPQEYGRQLKALLLNNLTGVYYMREMLDSARIFARRFELLGDSPEDERYRYDVYVNRGLLDSGRGNNRRAIGSYRDAVCYADTVGLDPIYKAAVYSFLSQSFAKENQLDSALHYMHLGERICLEGGHSNELVETLRCLSELYERNHDPETSLKYKSRYLSIADSVRLSEEREKIRMSELLYTLDSNADTIKGLNAIRKIQWRWLITLTVALLIVILLTVILFRQKTALKQAWKSLYDRSREELERENREAECRKPAVSDELRDELAERILKVMENTELICQPDFGIERLAAEVESNSRYVSEVINDRIGCNFRSMLNEYRVRRAMVMLSDSETYGHLTIKAIGESVGYKSQSTFITAFTRQTGLKPSIYHRLAKEGSATDCE